MSGHRDHPVGGEGEAAVVERGVRQPGEDLAAVGSLEGDHAHAPGGVLHGHVEPGVLDRLLDVGQVLVGGATRGSDVETSALQGENLLLLFRPLL